MTKEAADIVLVDMGLLTTLKQGNTRVCSQVWYDLCENSKTNYLELSIQSCNGICLYLVRLGNLCFSPYKIPNKKLKSPTKLVSRIQSLFMGLQLATMLDKSGKLEMILDLTYYDDAFSALVVEINIDKDEGALNKNAPFHTDGRKCVNFKALYELVSGANAFC